VLAGRTFCPIEGLSQIRAFFVIIVIVVLVHAPILSGTVVHWQCGPLDSDESAMLPPEFSVELEPEADVRIVKRAPL
jgi:hypothetical protein